MGFLQSGLWLLWLKPNTCIRSNTKALGQPTRAFYYACFLGATPGRKAPFQQEETDLPARGIMRAVQRAKTGCTLVPLCPLRSLVPAMGGLIIGGVYPVLQFTQFLRHRRLLTLYAAFLALGVSYESQTTATSKDCTERCFTAA